MYICDKHGELASEWCNECSQTYSCNHSVVDTIRFKDLLYECDRGDFNITIWLKFCKTCGEPVSIYL